MTDQAAHDDSADGVESLATRFAAEVCPPRGGAGDHLADVIARAGEGDVATLTGLPEGTAVALDAIFALSPYLRRLAEADPAGLAACLAAEPQARLDALAETASGDIAQAGDMAAAMAALRRYKNAAAMTIALADIGNVFDLAQVTTALTRIADTALSLSIRWLLTQAAERGKFRPADPQDPEKDCGLIVLAMGKQGAMELNFSSDIDIIVFFDVIAERFPDTGEAAMFFVRLTRDLVKLMQERTADGYVFRTDLRLRPDPGATAVAISTTGALHYYESLGQNWERAAMIKARPCAGDIAAGRQFLAEIRPFIWRKYMDFAAIADTQAMKRQIHHHKGHGDVAVAGHNIKLGRGGIREVEFFTQTQQLIGGGRDPTLRTRATRRALDALVTGNWIEPSVRDELMQAYTALRRVEHRLQMIADEQTHTIPADPDQLARVAAFCGFETVGAFEEHLTAVMRKVERHYARLFEAAGELADVEGSLVFTGGEDDPETIETLAQLGFANPGEVTAGVRGWHFGRYPALRSTRARELLTELTPDLLRTLAGTMNPDATFVALDRFMQNLPAGVQIFSLLKANPQLMSMIVDILGAAPRLADTLSRQPRLIDALIDPAYAGRLPDAETFARRLDRAMGEASGYEDMLDRVRMYGQEQMTLIGARLLTGGAEPEAAGEAFTTLADTILTHLHGEVCDLIAARHGRFAEGGSAIVAMGRLGSREMTAGSDLDLILIYDAEGGSDGDKPLGPEQYYIRLTQRLIAAISAPTAFGGLYEVDMRLRPSGRSGMLATRLNAFDSYQRDQAWTWEHMALTRARVVCGTPELTGRIEEIIAEVLAMPRDAQKIAADVRDMRERVAREKGSDDVWDLKSVRGGLTDLTFLLQYLVLMHGDDAALRAAGDTLTSIRALGDAGALSSADADMLHEAATLYGRVLQVLRLCTEGSFDPGAAPRGLAGLLARIADEPAFDRVEPRLQRLQDAVAEAFARIIGTSD